VKAVVAAVQAGFVLTDREATLDKTEGLVKEAATEGANLVVLPRRRHGGREPFRNTG
jgi:predicted amidohydrolase